MILTKQPFALVAAVAIGLMMPGVAFAQQGGTQAQRAENMQAATALHTRIDATQARIENARRTHKIARARATALNRQIAQTRQSMTRLGKQQGFVSAAELASYNRTLGTIESELDQRGVARSYGKDMLPAAPNGRH
ncbi:hypothetical protein QP178_05970 [Sphingomonas aurantiaca]|uniref:Heavy-metal resistance protein n=1 Tax=Sphingomonas aurantiaca TaxID=185949 RepID=A0A2T5GH53_9SPHN|nr:MULTISPECIES: hypothetical protein [Sphingomonas]KQN16258.1 hypothetical protein ASE79_06160 [Sphingomonas sp. Leaf28]PTQ58644.1 hypothetical protein C8J26_3512 [Sphingomonas aurantiaca]